MYCGLRSSCAGVYRASGSAEQRDELEVNMLETGITTSQLPLPVTEGLSIRPQVGSPWGVETFVAA